jgi:ABC-type transport system involved in multi-copper enzyme maturation permease subunit
MSSSRVRRTLDRLAYASLVLDICIAIITTLSLLGISEGQHLLVPINYLLTLVVVLSVVMFAVLVLLKAKEGQMAKSQQSGSTKPTNEK